MSGEDFRPSRLQQGIEIATSGFKELLEDGPKGENRGAGVHAEAVVLGLPQLAPGARGPFEDVDFIATLRQERGCA
jgi:hypothetical protein